MAISYKRTLYPERQDKHVVTIVGTITMDSSYPTGGEDISAIDGRIDEFYVLGGTRIYVYDRANKKLKAMKVNTTTGILEEVANATDLSAEANMPFIAKIWVE